MKNNNKGFTLVELIVVIALMISLLVIAIVSYVNISNQKKEEAWDNTKQEAEVAGQQYFETNGYMLETLIDGENAEDGSKVLISIGALVKEGYLNRVVNPVTGNLVNDCDYIEVTKKNGAYNYNYVENDDDTVCETESFIKTEVPGGPSLDAEITSGNVGENNYFVSEVNMRAMAGTNNNGAINSFSYCTYDGVKGDYVNCDKKSLSVTSNNKYDVTNEAGNNGNDAIDGSSLHTYFEVTNVVGKKAIAIVDYKKDTVKPSCSKQTGASTTWTNKTRYVVQYCSDDTSGCTKNETKLTYNSDKKTDKVTISDNAGNESTCNVNVYVDKTKPSCSVAFSGTEGENGWYVKKNVSVSLTKSYALKNGVSSGLSGYDLTTSSKASYNKKTSGTQSSNTTGTKWYGYVRDNAGNVNNCNKTVKLEKSVSLAFDVATTNNTVSNKNNSKIFNTNYSGIIKYGSGSSGNCHRKVSSGYIGCGDNVTKTETYYYGRSCEDVGDYKRTFKVTKAGGTSTVTYEDDKASDTHLKHLESGETNGSYTRKAKPNSIFDSYYTTSDINNKGSRVNFTKHSFQYVSEAGNKSNTIILYTEYSVDCGY